MSEHWATNADGEEYIAPGPDPKPTAPPEAPPRATAWPECPGCRAEIKHLHCFNPWQDEGGGG